MGETVGELESTRVARVLRDDIILGRRRPGSRLVERDIAAELDVSRLPVREAIRRLASEGIVVSRPRSWAVVREFTVDDVRDFAEMRGGIEILIFELAAARHDAVGLAHLRRIVEQEEEAAHAGDEAAARLHAARFHEYTANLASNDMLVELVGVFATRLRWVFGPHDDLVPMAAEHRAIYEAIAARDVELVRTLTRAHLAAGAEAAARRVVGQSSSPATAKG